MCSVVFFSLSIALMLSFDNKLFSQVGKVKHQKLLHSPFFSPLSVVYEFPYFYFLFSFSCWNCDTFKKPINKSLQFWSFVAFLVLSVNGLTLNLYLRVRYRYLLSVCRILIRIRSDLELFAGSRIKFDIKNWFFFVVTMSIYIENCTICKSVNNQKLQNNAVIILELLNDL